MKNYEIKMDGKEHKFGEATRYTKDGKGRFDLIPGDVIEILEDAKSFDEISSTTFTSATVYSNAFNKNFVYAILGMCVLNYSDDTSYEQKDVDLDKCFYSMIRDLAIHFQKGAEKYGEHNCEKGIPLWSFHDSGLRHLTQWLLGEHDENHFIAAVWNFVMAIWTIKNHPERCGDHFVEEINVTDAQKETCQDSLSSKWYNVDCTINAQKDACQEFLSSKWDNVESVIDDMVEKINPFSEGHKNGKVRIKVKPHKRNDSFINKFPILEDLPKPDMRTIREMYEDSLKEKQMSDNTTHLRHLEY